MAASVLYPRIVKQTGPVCSAVVLFLHGSGDTGEGVSDWVKMASKGEFHFPHAKVLYPTAPARPYTPMGGAMSNVWFDRMQISPNVPEHAQSVEAMCASLSALIQQEVSSGIPKSRIVIGVDRQKVTTLTVANIDQAIETDTTACYRCDLYIVNYHNGDEDRHICGFSMGGAMALHLSYRFHRDVAGVFALSSFLNNGSAVFKELEARPDLSPLPPLFYCQGEKDDLALPVWAENTFTQLSSVGVQGTLTKYPIHHELNKTELLSLKSWINERIPES